MAGSTLLPVLRQVVLNPLSHGVGHWVALVLLAALALLSQWLLDAVERGLDPPRPTNEPSLRLERFTAIRRHQDGQPQLVLMAPQLRQLAQQAGVEIDQPIMAIHTPDGWRQWLIHADRAWISDDQEQLWLYGNIQAVRFPRETVTALVFKGDRVLIEPTRQRASADQPAQLFTVDGVVVAAGFRADLVTQRLELTQVRSEYVP